MSVFAPFARKVAPGKYIVFLADISLTFKTERDAERFCNAAIRSITQSWREAA